MVINLRTKKNRNINDFLYVHNTKLYAKNKRDIDLLIHRTLI